MSEQGKNGMTAEYETSDVNIRNVFVTAFVILVVVVLVIVVMNEMFISSKEEQIYQSVLSVESPELRDLHAREASTLNSYKILDAEKGVYQIPIERAMKLEAEEAFQKQIKDG